MNGVGVPRVDPDCVHHLSLLVSESLPHITRASRVSVAPPTHCSVRASPHSTVRGGRPGDQVRTILGGAPRGCFTFRDLCSLALSSMKELTMSGPLTNLPQGSKRGNAMNALANAFVHVSRVIHKAVYQSSNISLAHSMQCRMMEGKLRRVHLAMPWPSPACAPSP